jgi:mannose-6-phosphate isomerase-like protein (cupin superfamily)
MESVMEKINLAEKFSLFSDQWSPKIIAELNGQHAKLAKVEGEFIWHRHDQEDELFLVVRGALVIELHGRSIHLGEGELLVVPAGVDHRPVAPQEAWILLLEPAATLNTGNIADERSVTQPEWI